MIIVDEELDKRQKQRNPVRIALVGAGYIGRGITLQVEQYLVGMQVAAISDRTVSAAERAYREAGIDTYRVVETVEQLEEAISTGIRAVTNNSLLLCQAQGVEAVIEATGTVEFGAHVTVKAIENGKHIILMNAELDATVGPILKVYADRHGVIITNADGDQPGVIMNLLRFVRRIGFDPVLAGNIKGLLDPYRTPETQKAFAQKHNLSPEMATSFADGTKISFENAVVANATGFRVGKRGMYGPRCAHVDEAANLFPMDQLMDGGIVDYILGAEPGGGVFILGHDDHPIRQEYMEHYKMGKGPLYVFYTPYHLPHVEAPLTAARAVLFTDATIAPLGSPVCDVLAIAKRDLKAGELLDGIGGFTCYGTIDNYDVCQAQNVLPMGLSEGCRLKLDIAKDTPIGNNDVEFPAGRLCDRLRAEQNTHFGFSTIS